jgi:eukaryotic-like serine/threonine-protein kinase
MLAERWREVKPILSAALDLDPKERPAFLLTACSGDPSLMQEVQSLLDAYAHGASWLEHSASLPSGLAPGAMLGTYRIEALIGAGGMGEVYRAVDVTLGLAVAIKVLPAALSADPVRLRRLEQEARAAAALNHPNILYVHRLDTHEGVLYIASELLEGQTLRAKMQHSRLPLSEVLDYTLQTANGIAAAHSKGIIHRDIKPENIFVTKYGQVKILDFGLAKAIEAFDLPRSSATPDASNHLTQTGTMLGTVAYMSPEQVRGQDVRTQSDVFSFGIVLYEMATGTRPFQGETPEAVCEAIVNDRPVSPRSLNPELPLDLERIVLRSLEKDRELRYRDATEVRDDLQTLQRQSAVTAGPQLWKQGRWVLLAVLVLAIISAIAGRRYLHWVKQRSLTEKDTVVLADFTNSTGDAVFDDTLKTALNVSLRQSPFLNVLSDSQVGKTLKQMTLSPDTKLAPEQVRELCQRAGSKAYVAGSIGSLGSEYVMGLQAVNCENGDTLAQEQVAAASKEKVLDALGEMASKLRGELGESLTTVRKFDVPLEQATTPSLEALKAYSLGVKASHEKGIAAALPYDQRAIELDPNFAMGYRAVGIYYLVLGEPGRAREYLRKAFQLREHSSEREKLEIAANYYWVVTGELDKAAQVFQEEIESYPRNSATYGNLSAVYGEQGQHEKAAQIARQGMGLSPDRVGDYENLANYDLALQRFDEARQVIHEAQARKMDDFQLHSALYTLAFLGADSAAMAQQQQWFVGRPEENWGLELAADSEAYAGRLGKARELTKRAVNSAIRADSKESGAIWQAIAAQREAVYGNTAEARQISAEALKLAPDSQGAEAETALAFAMAGDTAQAESLAQGLAKRFPLDTQMQALWLPAIHAQLALDKRNPTLALNTLQAEAPIELGQIGFVINLSCLYPVYVRGEAYLAAGQGRAAAAEFQRILDHGGIVWNCWTGALAHLGVSRANALEARTSQGADADAARARALSAYKEFLALWKDADADIPILKQAKAEYAKLQ